MTDRQPGLPIVGGRLAGALLNDFGDPDQEAQQPVELSAPGIGLLLKRPLQAEFDFLAQRASGGSRFGLKLLFYLGTQARVERTPLRAAQLERGSAATRAWRLHRRFRHAATSQIV